MARRKEKGRRKQMRYSTKINVKPPSPSRNEIILTGSEILLGKPS